MKLDYPGLRADCHRSLVDQQYAPGLAGELKIRQSLAYGCPLVIEAVWERLGLKKVLSRIVKQKGVRVDYERAFLAMVANRAALTRVLGFNFKHIHKLGGTLAGIETLNEHFGGLQQVSETRKPNQVVTPKPLFREPRRCLSL